MRTFVILKTIKKILLIRFSSIGDIVLTTPIIRCVKQQLNAEIHFLTKEVFAGLVLSNPNISKVITIKSKVAEVKKQLQAENYDFVIDLHHNLRTAQVKIILKKPSASFPKLNIKKWLVVNTPINLLPKTHIVDRYFETVKSLGITNDKKGLDYFIPLADQIPTSALPISHEKNFIAFTTGTLKATKQLPLNKMIAIIQHCNLPVIMLGSQNDFELAGKVEKACGEMVFNACGKYNLNESASIIQQAAFVIAHDTGLMHIAAAFKKKIFSVWGNTIPEFGMAPYLPGIGSEIIEIKNLDCRPCSKLGFDECPKGHFRCMNDIDVTIFPKA